MRQIAPNVLWIGNRGDLDHPANLRRAGVAVVVDLAVEERPFVWGHEGVVLRVPLEDGAGNGPGTLRLAIDVVAKLTMDAMPTLVVCSAGLSRSPGVVAFALARVQGRAPSEVARDIARHGPIDISPALWGELERAAAGDKRSE